MNKCSRLSGRFRSIGMPVSHGRDEGTKCPGKGAGRLVPACVEVLVHE
jgi:hypothetical protein